MEHAERAATGITELDRVLGGGLVPGSLLLVGGDPGIGKSTLMLQLAMGLAREGRKILYVSGEESEQQIRLRAARSAKCRRRSCCCARPTSKPCSRRRRASLPTR